jgi:5'-nucleotidase/UDP-sugar diphosphatase
MKKTVCMLMVLALVAPAFGQALTAGGSTGAPVLGPSVLGPAADPVFYLTVLHNNDGESQLINLGSGLEDFGGVARFKTLVDELKFEAVQDPGDGIPRGVVMISSGDNFLAGPEFNASLENGVPFFDTIAMDLIGYDAAAIGNHEFDFGPDVLAQFIDGFTTDVKFLSANLGFAGEPNLQLLVDEGVIAASTVLTVNGFQVGVVGATTPNLPFISSPRNVTIDPNVVDRVQEQVDELTTNGVKIIIFTSHLQSLSEDVDLLGQLEDIDVAIAGGGDELLANAGDLLVPGDEGEVAGPYPTIVLDMNNVEVPVITTKGSYGYVGRLVVGFDANGEVIVIDEISGPVRVSGVAPDAVTEDATVLELVTDPVAAAVQELANNIIGVTEVEIDGRRSQVRTTEANEGNLCADSLLWQATVLADEFAAPVPHVAFQNGGGIRNDSILPIGDLSELDTFDMLPFSNFVSIVPDIPPAQFKEILENVVSAVEFGSGRFAQVAGGRFVWDAAGTPQELDLDGNVVTPGTRVVEFVLNDGTYIVRDGAVVASAPDLHVATINFLAQGGDQYPFRGAPFITLGVTYQQALRDYIVDYLGGVVSELEYAFGGEGRITRIN